MESPPDSSQPVTQGNDAFFKDIYSNPEHATAFFKRHLSPAIVAVIDWSTLVSLPSSFVQSDLRQTHSDLLFSVRMGDRETLLHLLFEHQSKPDPLMPLRLLGYIVEVLNRHHDLHGLPLPPVIPFVLHQGPDEWKVSTRFEDLFELPPELSELLLPFLPKFHHGLLDLSRYDPATEEDDYRQRSILHLMKLAREQKVLGFCVWLAETFVGQLPDGLLKQILTYALYADSDVDVESFYGRISTNPELKKRTMSIAEQLLARGHKEGQRAGQWLGKIQLLQEFLGKTQSSDEELKALSLEQLEALHQSLRLEYEVRFKK